MTKINLEEGKVKRYERKTIGILGRVERKGSDNKNAVASAALGVVVRLKSREMSCGSGPAAG
jgi:hypothetical protein